VSLLSRLERLVDKEKHRECLDEIAEVRRDKLEKGDQLRIGVLESHCYFNRGDFNKAYETAQVTVEYGKKDEENKPIVIDAYIRMAEASLGLFQVDAAFKACEQAEELRQELPKSDESLREFLRASILYVESLGWYFRDDVHRGIDCAQESLAIRERLNDVPGTVSSLMRVGYLHLEVDYSKTLEYHERGIDLNRNPKMMKHVIQALQNKSLIHTWNGNWDEAEQLVFQSLSMARKYDLGRSIPTGLFCLAMSYRAKGDYTQAQKYFEQCLTMSENTGAGLLIAMSSNNLGEIHSTRGDLDEALAGYEKGMRMNKEMGRIKGYVVGLGNCGLVQYARGELNEALQILEEALAIAKARQESGFLMKYVEWAILYTVLILVDNGDIKRAQHHVDYLSRLADRNREELTNQIYYTTASMIMKSSTLSKNRALAKEYLTEVVNGKILDFEITSLAHLLLCDLLVEDLRISGDSRLLDELKILLNSFDKTILDQGSTSLQVEVLLLQSKVAILDLDMGRADRLLNQARSIADDKGLVRLSKRIIDEHEVLQKELSIWESLGEERPPLAEQTKKTRIHEQIGEMIQQGLWRKMLF
jgi:tetratricopeptide (TPR) repeat protein